MRVLFATGLLVLASSQPALSETCHETFVRLVTRTAIDVPIKNQVTTKTKSSTSINNFYMTKIGHWMTEMIKPASSWTLAHNNTMYVSSNKGKSWKKVRTMDSQKNSDTNAKNQIENAKTVKNAVCGKEDHNGVMHNTVEADIRIMQNVNIDYHYKYWVNPKTDFIAKATYLSKSKKYGSLTTQIAEQVPDLKLPEPK